MQTDKRCTEHADKNRGAIWILIISSKSVQIAHADSISETTCRDPCVSLSRSLITPLLALGDHNIRVNKYKPWMAPHLLDPTHTLFTYEARACSCVFPWLGATERGRVSENIMSALDEHMSCFVCRVSLSMSQSVRNMNDIGWLSQDKNITSRLIHPRRQNKTD